MFIDFSLLIFSLFFVFFWKMFGQEWGKKEVMGLGFGRSGCILF